MLSAIRKGIRRNVDHTHYPSAFSQKHRAGTDVPFEDWTHGVILNLQIGDSRCDGVDGDQHSARIKLLGCTADVRISRPSCSCWRYPSMLPTILLRSA